MPTRNAKETYFSERSPWRYASLARLGAPISATCGRAYAPAFCQAVEKPAKWAVCGRAVVPGAGVAGGCRRGAERLLVSLAAPSIIGRAPRAVAPITLRTARSASGMYMTGGSRAWTEKLSLVG